MSELLSIFPSIRENEILAPYTTFRVGGTARYFLIIKNREDLKKALEIAKEESLPVFILGGGSNVLVSSKGFPGLVIKNEMNMLRVEDSKITAESGTVLALVVKAAKDNGLIGIAALHGVPGTFGGAVRGNAGVPNCEMGSFVVSAILLDENLEFKTVDQEYFQYAYRYSRLKENREIIIEATIELTPGGNPQEIFAEMQEMLKSRKAKQPWGSSGGSYFKNPTKEYSAGFVVDQVGGKGSRVGGAQISEKHANFMINAGGATSDDIKNLASEMKRKVKEKFGVELHEEVEFIE
ncbi:MAG: UDP-N-acetylmuramate dehydrogenase [Candidatus Gracilibacteria bacterium]